MKLFDNSSINDFLNYYNSLERNLYNEDDTKEIFRKILLNNSCTLIKGKTKYNKKILYNNDVIGGLYGTRPTTTSKVALNLMENNQLFKDFINIIIPNKINNTKESNEKFHIRVTIVEGEFVAAILRIAPFVIGDGIKTVEQLITEKNSERKRSAFFNRFLLNVKELNNIKESELTKILPVNEVLFLSNSLSVEDGGESIDVTDAISKKLYNTLVKYVAAVPGLYTASIDIKIDHLTSDQFEFENIYSGINTLIYYLPYKGSSKQIMDYYVKALKTVYKKDNKIKLSKNEKVYINSLSKFRKQKSLYEDMILKIDTSKLVISNNILAKEIDRMKMYISMRNNVFIIDDSINSHSKFFNVDIENDDINIEQKDVLPLFNTAKNSRNIAEKALDNIIIPFPGFDSVKFDENYYYTDKSQKYGTSYQLYIQSFRICAIILLEFEKTKEINYLLKVKEIIYSWINFVNQGTDEKMVWYDHPTAYRTQVIVHFLYLAEENNIEINHKMFRSVLYKHGEILADDSIYKNNNHGLMMDKALLVLGNVLSEETFFLKGYYRAIETFWCSFSYKGTHLENSPDYHSMVLKMFNELETYLNKRDNSFGDTIVGVISLGENYLDTIKKPNNILPAIGDSGDSIRKTGKYFHNFCDVEAGIAVLQYESFKPFYTSFVCGYSSQVHKHRDDLSITLNYNGVDFIVDSGKFNYNSESPIRKYITSKDAHSSFTLKDYDYDISNNNRFNRNIEIESYHFNDRISYIRGSHKDYKNVNAELLRSLIQIKNQPILIIIDDSVNESRLNFRQNFNLDENVSVSVRKNKVQISSKDEHLTIKQFKSYDDLGVLNGDLSVPIAVNTIGFGEVAETKQVYFENHSENDNVFVTAIYDEKVIKNLDIKYKDKEVNIQINNEKYTIYN